MEAQLKTDHITEPDNTRSAKQILPGAIALLTSTMKKPTEIVVACDTREPDPHPWEPFWDGVRLERATLAVGDFCLAGNADVTVERKAPSDLMQCLTRERERFERELRRATHLASMAVVVSGSMSQCLRLSGMSPSAFFGTIASFSRRYRHPFLFCENDQFAAKVALAYLLEAPRQAQKLLKAMESSQCNDNGNSDIG